MKYLFAFCLLALLSCESLPKEDKVNARIDSLNTQYIKDHNFLVAKNDSLKSRVDTLAFYVDELIKHDLKVDSVLDKEIKHASLAKKIGKRLRQVAEGAIGL